MLTGLAAKKEIRSNRVGIGMTMEHLFNIKQEKGSLLPRS